MILNNIVDLINHQNKKNICQVTAGVIMLLIQA